MTVHPIPSIAADPLRPDPLVQRQRSFASVLGVHERMMGTAEASAQERARDAAEQLVALAFLQPLLRQLRDSNQAPPPFSPTPAERQFGALRDAEVAREMVRAWRLPLVDRMARDLLERSDRAQVERVITGPAVPPLPMTEPSHATAVFAIHR